MEKRIEKVIDAAVNGLVDGIRHPALGFGITYENHWQNELYDSCVNFGQFLGKLADGKYRAKG